METTQNTQLPVQNFYTIKHLMDEYHLGRTTIYRLMKKHGVDPIMVSDRSPRLTREQVLQMFPEDRIKNG